jgi:hypothetical protein
MNLKIPHPHPAKALSFLFPALVAAADASPEHLANVRTLDRPPAGGNPLRNPKLIDSSQPQLKKPV